MKENNEILYSNKIFTLLNEYKSKEILTMKSIILKRQSKYYNICMLKSTSCCMKRNDLLSVLNTRIINLTLSFQS